MSLRSIIDFYLQATHLKPLPQLIAVRYIAQEDVKSKIELFFGQSKQSRIFK